MSEQSPEVDKVVVSPRETGSLEHGSLEEKSITGSAQSIGIEPSDTFVAPSMSLDSIEPTPDN